MTLDRFAALADPLRRRILVELTRSGAAGRTAGELAGDLGRGRPLVSYHLERLVAAALVTVEPDPADRRRRIYRAAGNPRAAAGQRAPGDPGEHPPDWGAVAAQGLLPTTGPRPVVHALVAPADLALGALAEGLRVPPGGPQPMLGRGLTPEVRARLGRHLQRRRGAAGQILFSQDDPPSGIWFVESGAIRLYASDADGREQTLQVVRAGASFNEVPFFDLGPEPATAQVVEPSKLLVLPVERREEILRAAPELAIAAAASFAFRLRQSIALVEDLSFRQLGGRVARVLLQAVAPHPGVGAGSGGRPLTQREIAEMVGSSREVVARTLRQLEREGLIRVERGRIVLLDREGLASRA
jgi:CRP/FNR family transcriptional regulator, cyclic AMP receptor protein